MKLKGVFVPLVTPFQGEEVDFASYRRMIDHFCTKQISGLIPLGTTGESPTIEDYEYEAIIEKTMEYNNGRLPIIVGAGGNHTKKVIKQLKILEKYSVDGILSVSPYYNRPDQRGIYQHFSSIASSTDLPIILYNIPYRTGRNIENSTIHQLSEIANIVGIKDSCGDIKQTLDLLLHRPKDFSILTGEDIFYYTTLIHGGDGGILASANINTEMFVEIFNDVQSNDHQRAFQKWTKLADRIPLLFEEPNPAPIKYCLFKAGLLKDSSVRQPLVEITDGLKRKLDQLL